MLSFTRASTAMAMACIVATIAAILCVYWEDAPDTAQQRAQYALSQSITLHHGAPSLQLKMADRFAYRRIFALQKQANWRAADALIAQLENPVLLGKILAERYLHPRYKTSSDQLVSWLQQYSALSEAPRIAALAARKGVAMPELASLKPSSLPAYLPSADRKTELRFGNTLVKKYLGWSPLRQHINTLLRAERRTQALAVLAKARDLTPRQYDLLRWSIASSAYNHGEYAQAALLAAASANRSGKALPTLHWLAGISAWHQSHYSEAYRHFEKMAAAGDAIPLADSAAAAFWAYRAAKMLDKPAAALSYLKQASATGDTFYGLQAAQILAEDAATHAAGHSLDGVELAALRKHYALDAILALAEIGHIEQASEEWAYQQERASPAAKAPLMAIAGKLQLSSPNAILDSVNPENYPRPSAFRAALNSADPALLYAIIKQESGFNTLASSHRGARGAMQLMPDTADFLMQKIGKSHSRNLNDTTTNITLGQAYLKVLETQPHIGNNLVYMLTAYNAGPTILGKWLRERPMQEDPLLFIESIPYTETRSYVAQVLKNYWVYRSLIHQNEQPALPQMLTGEWPRYAALEPQKVASLR